MNYEETIEKIHGFQKFGSRLGLERMTVLMELLGNPQDRMQVIHVAGTNGKGSVCRYLASVLQENGYRTGLYTSPYLERFTERIEYDGREISREELTECAAVVFQAVDRMLEIGYESPTEFELVTAIGFVYFSGKPMDVLVLEVGLGGRGDSTNIIKLPLTAVITSISYDHMNVLGETLAEIAGEKAGIIKASCPVVSNVKDPEAAAVIRKTAEERGCLFLNAAGRKPHDVKKSLEGYGFTVDSFSVELSMIGMHQVENAICALSVIEILAKKGIIKVEAEKIQRGFKAARQKGRLEVLQKDPLLIIDGAHNEAGVKALTKVAEDHFRGQKLLLIIGMLADKEVGRLVEDFCTISGDIAATEPDNPRKLPAEQLCSAVNRAGSPCVALGDCEQACSYIRKQMGNYDAILVSGSLYLIGRVRGQFAHEDEESLAGL